MTVKRTRSDSEGEDYPELEPLPPHERDDSEDVCHRCLPYVMSLQEIEKIMTAKELRRLQRAEAELGFESHSSSNRPDDASQDVEDGVEPFDTRDEEQDDSLAPDGTYIRNKPDDDEEKDAWLESMEKESSVLDSVARTKAELGASQREAFWSETESEVVGPSEPIEVYLYRLLRLLRPAETPRSAMDRMLGKSVPSAKASTFKSTIKLKRKTAESTGANTNDVPIRDLPAFEKVTELTDSLIAKGIADILTYPYEHIAGLLNRVQLEYRWRDKNDDQIHGPYSHTTLMEWFEKGYFAANPIQVRYANSNGPWSDFNPVQ